MQNNTSLHSGALPPFPTEVSPDEPFSATATDPPPTHVKRLARLKPSLLHSFNMTPDAVGLFAQRRKMEILSVVGELGEALNIAVQLSRQRLQRTDPRETAYLLLTAARKAIILKQNGLAAVLYRRAAVHFLRANLNKEAAEALLRSIRRDIFANRLLHANRSFAKYRSVKATLSRKERQSLRSQQSKTMSALFKRLTHRPRLETDSGKSSHVISVPPTPTHPIPRICRGGPRLSWRESQGR